MMQHVQESACSCSRATMTRYPGLHLLWVLVSVFDSKGSPGRFRVFALATNNVIRDFWSQCVCFCFYLRKSFDEKNKSAGEIRAPAQAAFTAVSLIRKTPQLILPLRPTTSRFFHFPASSMRCMQGTNGKCPRTAGTFRRFPKQGSRR